MIDVLRPLAHAIMNPVLGLEDLARAGIDLASNEEGDQLLGEVVEINIPIDKVIFMAPVTIADEIRVVLEDREFAGNSLLANLFFGVLLQIFENPLARFVVNNQLLGRCTLGGRVFGVAAGVLVESSAVLEKDIEEVLGGNQLLEEKANRLLHREGLAPFGRKDDPVFRFNPVDSLLHCLNRPFGPLLCRERSLDEPSGLEHSLYFFD